MDISTSNIYYSTISLLVCYTVPSTILLQKCVVCETTISTTTYMSLVCPVKHNFRTTRSHFTVYN